MARHIVVIAVTQEQDADTRVDPRTTLQPVI
jgi:hypothetical protein